MPRGNRASIWKARLRLLIEIARTVHHAHECGVIHRDLKPGNILIDESGHAKVLDFGIARLRHDAAQGLTQDGQVLGTLPYMSPEQLLGDSSKIDVRKRCIRWAWWRMS